MHRDDNLLRVICQMAGLNSSIQNSLLIAASLTHSERRPKNIYSQAGKKPSISSSNWQHKFLYFHYKSKLDVLCTQNKIWTFGHPFQSKKLPICTQNSDLQYLYMSPIWGFTDYFAWNNSYEPSQHLTVTNEDSIFAEFFFLSFDT